MSRGLSSALGAQEHAPPSLELTGNGTFFFQAEQLGIHVPGEDRSEWLEMDPLV